VGRHSSGGGRSLYLSFALWAIPWVVIASLVGFGVWAAVNSVGGDEVTVQSPSPSDTPRPKPTKTRTEPTPAEPTPAEPSPTEPSPTATRQGGAGSGNNKPSGDKDGVDGLHPDGVTVQVINGTGGIQGAAEAMADQLARLGYTVVAFTTGLTVDHSVVYFANPAAADEAAALASYLGFVAGGPAPPDLTRDIDLHIIVSAADA
jgi:LytR cell envelope-related transcriptional attenuator